MKRTISALGCFSGLLAISNLAHAGETDHTEPKGATPTETGVPATGGLTKQAPEEFELEKLHELVRRKEKEESLRERLDRVEERARTRTDEHRERERPKKPVLPWAHKGRFVFSDVAGLRAGVGGALQTFGLFSFNRASREGATPSVQTSFSFRPSIDEFVKDRLTLGGAIEVASLSHGYNGTGTSGAMLRIGSSPRVGLVTPLGPSLLWWRVGMDVSVDRYENSYGEGTRWVTLGATASVDAIFPLHPNVFLAAGPEFSVRHVAVDASSERAATMVLGDTDQIALGLRANIGLTLP